MDLRFEPGLAKDQLVVVLVGDLDLYASVDFCNQVIKKMEEGQRRVVLDLTVVRYMDSSGVGAVIRLVQKARTLTGEIRLAGLVGTPKKVLEMSNIVSLMKVFPDKAAALAAWN